ncbi:MAG: hypothetical protein ACI959_002068 [Limisphaerales bacterium]|jgi:hypothetical protein
MCFQALARASQLAKWGSAKPSFPEFCIKDIDALEAYLTRRPLSRTGLQLLIHCTYFLIVIFAQVLGF